MRWLVFVTWRCHRLTMVVVAISGLACVALSLAIAEPREDVLTVSVIDLPDPRPISAIQVYSGRCILQEATPSPSGTAVFTLKPGDYTISAWPNASGKEAGWASSHVQIHVASNVSLLLGHKIVPPSDLDAVRAPPPSHCHAMPSYG